MISYLYYCIVCYTTVKKCVCKLCLYYCFNFGHSCLIITWTNECNGVTVAHSWPEYQKDYCKLKNVYVTGENRNMNIQNAT